MLKSILRHIPLLDSLRGYGKPELRSDLTAGLTVAVMLIPQGMAYAMLAGLPPIAGLYASTLPLLVYALFGTSRQLAVGPVAMVSLMVAAGVSPFVHNNPAAFWAYAVILAALVGVIQLTMGVARLGFLVNFLSHPVVSGFTSAAALIIGFSQLQHLLGVDIKRSHHVHSILLQAAGQISEIQPETFAIGFGSVLVLLALKRWAPKVPGALTVVVLGTGIVALFGLHDRVGIVGDVPQGLPSFAMPSLEIGTLRDLLPTALAISLVGFMESISVAKAFARKNHYEIDANRELIGLGVANIAGSMLQGYPVTGGFSRTAVNAEAGAKTGIASIVTAAVIALTLILLTPLFYYLPKAVLAAIIMVAVFGLVDIKEVKHLYHVKRGDLALLVITFVATLSLGIEQGIAAGVAASILALIYRTSRPHVAVLGRLPETHIYRNVKHYPEAEITNGVLAVRIDASFYFGNVTFLKDTLRRLLRESTSTVKAILIEAASINNLDSSADGALHELVRELREDGVDVFFANVRGPVRQVMDRSGFTELLGEDHFTYSMRRAMRLAVAHVQRAAKEAANHPLPEPEMSEDEEQADSRRLEGANVAQFA